MMLAPARISCLWPGLAWVWWQGSARGLIVAVGFGWTLTILLLATFVWPNWFWPSIVTIMWLGLLAFWCVEIVRSNLTLKQLQSHGLPINNDQRFTQAQEEYLRGNWFEAESLLQQILRDAPKDAEAHLLLIGVLRHCRRWSAAERRLVQLESLDTAARWRFEIAQERQLLERRKAAAQSDEPKDESEVAAASEIEDPSAKSQAA